MATCTLQNIATDHSLEPLLGFQNKSMGGNVVIHDLKARSAECLDLNTKQIKAEEDFEFIGSQLLSTSAKW